jgi:glycosyltransferase involved in cell wall biosynthesis
MSPLRRYFHWILMPTVDSEPQQEDWIDTFLEADAIFTYSDWGAEVLKKQSSNKINYIDTASPGVDLSVFNIIEDSKRIKTKLGINPDTIIVGSVMRNQKRKLIPELLFSFRKLLDTLEKNNPELGKKLFLYLHTSYPDAGWDIPELLKETRLSNKVLFTYVCGRCGNVESHTFSHPVQTCKKCYEVTSRLPSVAIGVPNNILAEIYNVFDVYVQYAICEGFGMPQVEAAACGVPVITIDYSAMCDIIKKLEAYKVEIQTKFKELETKALRVYPNNDDLIKHIMSLISLPDAIRSQKRQKIRTLTEKYYNWNHIANIWENYLDSLDKKGYRSKKQKTNGNKIISAVVL